MLTDAVGFAIDPENIKQTPKEIPLFFVSGALDPVGGFGKGVKEAAMMYKRAGMAHVALKLYPDDRHEILNETDRQQVFADLYRWMKKGF